MAESAGASSFFPLVVLLLAGSSGPGPRGIQGESGGGGRGPGWRGPGEGEASRRGAWATARPFPTRTIWPGGGRGGVGVTAGASPDPLGSAVQPRPCSRRAPEDSSPLSGGAGLGELSGLCSKHPMYFIKGARASFQKCADDGCAPPLVQGGGLHVLPPGAPGGAFPPAKIAGQRRQGPCFPRCPDAGSPGAAPMVAGGLQPFLPTLLSGHLLPHPLMFWTRGSHFPVAQPLEFSGAAPPPIHMPRGSSLQEVGRQAPAPARRLPPEPL